MLDGLAVERGVDSPAACPGSKARTGVSRRAPGAYGGRVSEDQRALEVAVRHAQTYLAELGTRAVGATVDLPTLRARLGKPLADHGVAVAQVIDELVRDAAAACSARPAGVE
jgi:hypothetical protein